jgi:hypothetical protein
MAIVEGVVESLPNELLILLVIKEESISILVESINFIFKTI